MSTKIEWCDETWTPIVGCDPVSPACAFCYAATMAARLEAMGIEKYAGLATRQGALGKWTGNVTVWEPEILRPLSVKKSKRWFLTSMGDVGHKEVSDETLVRLFAVMIVADWHEFYVLTKRPERVRAFLAYPATNSRIAEAVSELVKPGQEIGHLGLHFSTIRGDSGFRLSPFPRDHILIGSTVEDQERADERRPHMAAIAALGWRTMVSYEPALELVNWNGWEFLKWLIGGGESGPKARPCHPDWQRGARDWCAARGIPYLLKQWGEHIPLNADDGLWPTGGEKCFRLRVDGKRTSSGWPMQRVGKKRAGRLLDGVEHNGFPVRA